MKSAEEVAKDLVIDLDKGFYPFNMEQKDRADKIKKALTTYAEERVHEERLLWEIDLASIENTIGDKALGEEGGEK